MDPVAERPKPTLLRRLLPLVGLGMALWFVSRLDLRSMRDAVVAADAFWVAVAVAAMVGNVLVKAWRWLRLLRSQPGVVVGAGDATWMFIEAAFLGSFTFGRVGEFVRVARLAERGVATDVGFASCVVDRGLDLAALLVIGGACWLGLEHGVVVGVAVAVVGVVALVVGSVVARVVAGRDIDDGARFRRLRLLIRGAARFCVPPVFAEAMLWTVVGWGFAFAIVWSLARALSLTASVAALTAAHAMASVSTLLPVTYQGVGTREPIFAAVLGNEGVSHEHAVVLALLTFVVMLATVVALGLVEAVRRRAAASTTTTTPNA